MGDRRAARLAVVAGTLLVAAVVLGGQLLASASGPSPAKPAAPAASSQPADDDGCGSDTDSPCGNDHSRAIQKWVGCKAEKGKDACTKPAPPGKSLGHTKHAGPGPGPASSDGQGHGWGRAHAPGQLKTKDKKG